MATIAELIQLAQDKLELALNSDSASFWYRVGNKMVNKEHYIDMLLRTIAQLNENVEPDFDTIQFDICTGNAGQDCTEYLDV